MSAYQAYVLESHSRSSLQNPCLSVIDPRTSPRMSAHAHQSARRRVPETRVTFPETCRRLSGTLARAPDYPLLPLPDPPASVQMPERGSQRPAGGSLRLARRSFSGAAGQIFPTRISDLSDQSPSDHLMVACLPRRQPVSRWPRWPPFGNQRARSYGYGSEPRTQPPHSRAVDAA